jgi:hypothetical protein
MKHFTKHWAADLQAEVQDAAEEVVRFRLFSKIVPL